MVMNNLMCQSTIAEKSGGALGELRQLVQDGVPKLVEVVAPGMGMGNLLVQQAPELLYGAQPGSIGGQGKHHQARVFLNSLKHS